MINDKTMDKIIEQHDTRFWMGVVLTKEHPTVCGSSTYSSDGNAGSN